MRYYLDQSDPLVLLDLTELLGAHDPDANVVVVSALADVVPPIPRRAGAVLVTSRSVEELRGDQWVASFTEGGGRLVVLDRPDGTGAFAQAGWVYLDRPFTDEAFLDALARAQL
jgi:hypothetical protein